MRISPDQTQTICRQIHAHLGAAASIWLFGSRVNDHQKGGDVDLYVEASPHPLRNEILCKIELEESLDMPVDLIVRQPFDNSPIATIAKGQGVKL